MLSILQLSDLHFGSAYVPRVGDAALDAAREIDADAIVISGDLTQRAKAREFRDAAAFMKQLPDVPALVIPGNHDVPLYRIIERLTDPYKHYREIISGDQARSLCHRGNEFDVPAAGDHQRTAARGPA